MGITVHTTNSYQCDNCHQEINSFDAIINGEKINLLHKPYHDSDRSFDINITVHIENVFDDKPCICKDCFNKLLTVFKQGATNDN